jgi:YbbR domain-containing protein
MAYHPFRNLGLKLVALSLATLLWVAVGGQETAERYLPVPIEFQNVPAGLEIAGETPVSVNVRVRGSSGNLARMQLGEVLAVLDLRRVRPGTRLFHVSPEQVRTPYGVEVVEVSPSSFSLSVERSRVRDVPVVPDITGEPAPGYVKGKVTTEPATVQVAGPESRVRDVTGATTEPVSITGAAHLVQEQVAIGVPDAEVRLLGAREALVRVEIRRESVRP